MFLKIKTKRLGWSCAVAVSALQKGCRRCDPDLALTAASELILTGYAGSVWKRMLVICCEDIGPANPLLVETVMTKYDQFTSLLRKNKLSMKCVSTSAEALDLVFQTLMEVIQSPKSRITDNGCYVWLKDLDRDKLLTQSPKGNSKVERLLEYGMKVEDIHTCLSIFVCLFHMNRFKKDAPSGLDSEIPVKDIIMKKITEYEFKNKTYMKKCKYSPRARLWGKILTRVDNVLAYGTLAFTPMMNGSMVKGLVRIKNVKALDLGPIDMNKYLDPDWKYELPAYVFDKHTVEGARKGFGIKHFFGAPCFLNNMAFESEIEDYYKSKALEYRTKECELYGKLGSTRGLRARIRSKYEVEKKENNNTIFKSDLEVFTECYRPQMITSGYKQVVFFANYQGRSVVVKGPYPENKISNVISIIKTDEQKGSFGLRRCNPTIIKLIPDYIRSQNDVQAIANYKNRLQDPTTFIIFDSLVVIPKDPITYQKTSKKMIKEMTILDVNKLKVKPLDFIMMKKELSETVLGLELMKVLLFRWVLEINDTCNRNILVDTICNKIYSVDEESTSGGRRKYFFKKKLTGISRNVVNGIIYKYNDDIKIILSEWKCKNVTKTILDNIEILINADLNVYV